MILLTVPNYFPGLTSLDYDLLQDGLPADSPADTAAVAYKRIGALYNPNLAMIRHIRKRDHV